MVAPVGSVKRRRLKKQAGLRTTFNFVRNIMLQKSIDHGIRDSLVEQSCFSKDGMKLLVERDERPDEKGDEEVRNKKTKSAIE